MGVEIETVLTVSYLRGGAVNQAGTARALTIRGRCQRFISKFDRPSVDSIDSPNRLFPLCFQEKETVETVDFQLSPATLTLTDLRSEISHV